MILERFVCGPISTNCYLFGGYTEDAEIEVVLIDAEVRVWDSWSDKLQFVTSSDNTLMCVNPEKHNVLKRVTPEDGYSFFPSPRPEKCVGELSNSSLNLKAIIATHGHYDHVRGVGRVQKETGAPFWIHTDAENTLNDPRNDAEIGALPKAVRYLKDGDRVEVGGYSLQVIHTPGHSPGGICLYLAGEGKSPVFGGAKAAAALSGPADSSTRPDSSGRFSLGWASSAGARELGSFSLTGLLFTGDLLFKGGVGRTDLAGGDSGELRKSLEKLKELPPSTLVLPGHGPPTVLGRELGNLL